MSIKLLKNNKYLTKEELLQTIQFYQKSLCDKSLTSLVQNFTGLVHRLAGSFSRGSDTYEDLVQVGMVGLIMAIQKFDHSLQLDFEKYAVPTIVGEVKKHIRDKTWSVHVPRSVKELVPKINKVTDILRIKYEREPRPIEIAAYLDISFNQVIQAMNMFKSYKAISIDKFMQDQQDGCKLSLSFLIGTKEEGYTKVEQRMLLVDLFKILHEREKQVLKLSFIYDLSQQKIAKRLGISQMHVSRIQKKAIRKIRRHINTHEELVI